MVSYLHTSSGPVAVIEVRKPHLSEDYMVKASLILHIAVILYRLYLVQLLFSPSYNHFLLSPHPLTSMFRSGHTHTDSSSCLFSLPCYVSWVAETGSADRCGGEQTEHYSQLSTLHYLLYT